MSKVWHTKEWLEMRNRLIKGVCDQCGSLEGPMVLQHLWHPPQYAVISGQVFSHILRTLLESNKLSLPKRMCCPTCMSLSIRSRQSMQPKWVCIRCNNSFDTPHQKEVVDKEVCRTIGKKYGRSIHALSKEISEKYHKLYMSGSGTITMCKKCAFLWDVKNMRLCQVCKKNYHKAQYPCCSECKDSDYKPESYPDEWIKSILRESLLLEE